MSSNVLRFTTAGNVDDGKSTLIGRLLVETQGAFEDQIEGAKRENERRGGKGIDFSLLTDGLKAEREQGITIDVAYRYFATSKRKFIIADAPGHEQYTRNLVTSASNSDLAVILIDARNGIMTQSRRHAFIAHLLGIRHFIVAINKMDLVDFRRERYDEIGKDFTNFIDRLGGAAIYCVPISALEGDLVTEPSPRMSWYTGPKLLELLEKLWPGIPRHPGTGFGNQVSFQSGYRDAVDRGSAEPVYKIRKIFPNFVVSLPPEIHKIHLVDRDDEVTDAQKMRNESVTPRLRHDSIPRIDQNDCKIAVTGTRDEITRVLFVAGRIRDDELTFRRV